MSSHQQAMPLPAESGDNAGHQQLLALLKDPLLHMGQQLLVQWIKNQLISQIVTKHPQANTARLRTALDIFFTQNSLSSIADGQMIFSQEFLQEIITACYDEHFTIKINDSQLELKTKVRRFGFHAWFNLQMSLENVYWQSPLPTLVFSVPNDPLLTAEGILERFFLKTTKLFYRQKNLESMLKNFSAIDLIENKIHLHSHCLPILATLPKWEMFGFRLVDVYNFERIFLEGNSLIVQGDLQPQVKLLLQKAKSALAAGPNTAGKPAL